MKINFVSLDRRLKTVVQHCIRCAVSQRTPVYLVGGWVRDMILRRPNFDLDFVVEGDALPLARRLAKDLRARLTVHPTFGTATLHCPSGLDVDLATCRQETYKHPGALPVVKPGNLHEDLYRRDFTINTLAVPLKRMTCGEVLDFYNGYVDLRQKEIRILHARSFMDDPTRILRAVRFEQRLGFTLERQTRRCLSAALQAGVLGRISGQRYFQELRKALKDPQPVAILKRLYTLNALTFLKRQERPNFRALNSAARRLQRLGQDPGYAGIGFYWVYFMTLAGTLPRSALQRFMVQLPLMRTEKECLALLPKTADWLRCLGSPRLSPGTAALMMRRYPLEALVYWRLCAQSRQVVRRIDRYIQHDRFVRLDIDGHDLQRMGMSSGRLIGETLARIRAMKIDGQLHTRRQQIGQVRRMHISEDQEK